MKKHALLVVVAVVVVLVLVVALVMSRAELSRLRGKAAMYEQRCRAVRLAMRMDARELADPSTQKAASLRFAEAVADHSLPEILACIQQPVDFARREECLIKKDYGCLAALARAAEQAIPPSE